MKKSEFMHPLPPCDPPPLPPVFFPESKIKVNPFTLSGSKLFKVEDCELEVAVQRLLSTEGKLKGVYYLKNFSLVPQLQDGPMCGLVALSISTSASNNFVSARDILELALEHGFTKKGEIFDANALAILAEELGFETEILIGGLQSHLSCILESLLNEFLLLVPYDADFNHAPCCKNGSRAHWAVISGFVIMEEKSDNEESSDTILINSPRCSACYNKVNTDGPLYFADYEGKMIVSKNKKADIKSSKNGKVFLVGLQGKSRHIGLWSFHDMALSNNNLIYFPPTRNPEMYMVPDGGIVTGLKGRAILLKYSGSRT